MACAPFGQHSAQPRLAYWFWFLLVRCSLLLSSASLCQASSDYSMESHLLTYSHPCGVGSDGATHVSQSTSSGFRPLFAHKKTSSTSLRFKSSSAFRSRLASPWAFVSLEPRPGLRKPLPWPHSQAKSESGETEETEEDRVKRETRDTSSEKEIEKIIPAGIPNSSRTRKGKRTLRIQ